MAHLLLWQNSDEDRSHIATLLVSCAAFSDPQ